MSYLSATPIVLFNYDKFVKHFKLMFEDLTKSVIANRSTRELNKGSQSIVDYVNDTRLLAQDPEWNEVALIDYSQKGFADEILDELT